jgi:hypothetical protein
VGLVEVRQAGPNTHVKLKKKEKEKEKKRNYIEWY